MHRIILNISVSCILLIATAGFTVSEHYCGDKLVSFSVNKEAKSCCNMNGACCHNESQHFQMKEDFIPATFHFSPENTIITEINLFSDIHYNLNIPAVLADNRIPATESPPPPELLTYLSRLQTYLL